MDNSPAADPISVSLAAQAGKAINVPEAKLAYGFAQKPVDGEKKVVFSNVPEENLFKLKSDVITLKKRTYATKQEDEEEYAEEEQEQEQSSDDEEAPQLTYKQLGYITEQYKNPKFRKISSSSSSYAYKDSSESGYGKVAGKVSVDCGFKPGRITSYRKSKREESDDGYYWIKPIPPSNPIPILTFVNMYIRQGENGCLSKLVLKNIHTFLKKMHSNWLSSKNTLLLLTWLTISWHCLIVLNVA